MVERSALVEELVLTSHLNVAERELLGSEVISISEVRSIILRSLERIGRFPQHAVQWEPGALVFEGHFLEMLDGGRVRMWWQRSAPIDPLKLAERRHWDFSNSAEAANEFVRREWVTGDIDGISITE